MEIVIKIQGLEGIVGAINNLASALSGNHTQLQNPVKENQTPVNQSVQASIPQQPVQQPLIQAQPPIQQQVQSPITQQPQQQVQTSTANYTLDDISKAAMTLLDSGRQPELLNLLAQFGVESLPALPAEQYGAFATALRGLGAQI